MKRKIPAMLLALLLAFSAALPASAAGRACLRTSPASACPRLPACWQQLVCSRPGSACDDSQAPSQPSGPETPSEPEQPDVPSEPDRPSGSTSVLDYEQQVVTLVNAERAKYGLAALTLDETLCGYARVKSQDMHDQGYFSHTSPTYGSPFDMMRAFGVSYRAAGENIAMGYATPAAVVEAWMNSEGHRANILSANYTTLGVGYVADGGYWTQWFIG